MTYEEKLARFNEHIEAGGKVETEDWMPDDYRRGVLKFVEMHANSEIMGASPSASASHRALTAAKDVLAAKIQDEVGHAQLLYRVAEDLGKSRDTMFDDLVNGKSKFHNVFHYPVQHWGDVAIIGWLIDGAALVTQAALLDSSLRALRRASSSASVRRSSSTFGTASTSRWSWPPAPTRNARCSRRRSTAGGSPIIHFFGPRSNVAKDLLLRWKVKTRTNEDLRQEFLDRYVPKILELGFTFPTPSPTRTASTG